MKKMSVSLMLAVMLSLSMMGQKSAITLTFTSTYYQGGFIPLDSIRVTNYTMDMDTVLFYPDTLLVLESTVGISGSKTKEEGFRILQNCPNPATGQTRISIFIPEKDKVRISVSDVNGRSLFRSDWQLDRGYHSFYFTAGETGLLFLTATWKGINSTIKILSESISNSQNALTYEGLQNTGLNLKTDEQALGFTFHFGDSLIYIGYSKTSAGIIGSDVLEDKPQSNETYLFEIVEGIPCPGVPAINYGGQIYTTVQIGTQCWFKENLNIGTMIPGNTNQTNNSIIEKYCYNNDTAKCNVYGGLYQWDEAMQYVTTEGAQGICPDGWHLPSNAEFVALSNILGNWGIAGAKMKEKGVIHWSSPNTGATNSSGFTGLGGGGYFQSPYFFFELYLYACFWSSTKATTTDAHYRFLYYDALYFADDTYFKTNAFSVRCLRN